MWEIPLLIVLIFFICSCSMEYFRVSPSLTGVYARERMNNFNYMDGLQRSYYNGFYKNDWFY